MHGEASGEPWSARRRCRVQMIHSAADNHLAAFEYRLDALNFFLADVRGGLGAFVSVFLVTSAGWTPAEIGAVLTVSGLIGIAAHGPVGALIDRAPGKRGLLVAGVAALAVCAVAIERSPTGPVVFAADVAMAVLGGVFAPTVAALTLGMVTDIEFAARLARNAVWDRIGNLLIAALVGLVGVWLGQRSTFYLVPFFAVISAFVILTIPASAIDAQRARGFIDARAEARPQRLRQLITENRPLLMLAGLAAIFHFANGAMLPLIGQKLALAHPGFETATVSACIIVAQLVSIIVAIVVGRYVQIGGCKPLLLIACLALVARGVAFAWFDSAAWLIAAQIFDGISTGIWDVLIPLMLADVVAGSGRYSTSRGILGTVQGIGGSLSNVAGGTLVVAFGYGAAFLMFAVVGVAACVVVALMPEPAAVKGERLWGSNVGG